MADQHEFKSLEIDAIREVANIGAGHAATALSQMIERTVMISVPEVSVVPLEEVGHLIGPPDHVVVGVLMQMMGDLTGRTLLVFPEPAARNLCDVLLRRPPGTTQTFEEMEQSGLKEVGNILSSAYFNALSDFMGMMLLPSVPSLVIDYSAAVLTSTTLNFGQERDFVFCVETDLTMRDTEESVTGHFMLLPDLPSLRAIFDAIRLA
jgi:chemotaxis protein CheC